MSEDWDLGSVSCMWRFWSGSGSEFESGFGSGCDCVVWGDEVLELLVGEDASMCC